MKTNKPPTGWLALFALMISFIFAGALQAAPWSLISAKYRHNDNDTAYSGAALLGTAGDQWNDINDGGNTTAQVWPNAIVDSAGVTVPGVAFQWFSSAWGGNYWNATDYWAGGLFHIYNPGTPTTPYYDLLRSYWLNVDQQVTGLTPNALYDLVVYVRSQDNRWVQIWANGVQQSSPSSNTLPGSPLVIGRDAMVFKGLAADSSGNIRWYRSGGDDYAPCGFQLRPHNAVPPVPTGTDKAITIAKSSYHTFTAADFGFASADPLNSLVKVKITQVPAVGSLTLSGVTVLTNQIIPAASLGSLKFTPVSGMFATPYDTLQFQVNDGTNYSAAANTMTLNVYNMPGLINVKYYHSEEGDPTYSGAAAIGTTGDLWNHIDGMVGSWSNNFTSVVDSTGAPVPPVSISVNRGGWWGNGAGRGDYNFCGGGTMDGSSPYYDLMRTYFGYVDTTVSGLSAGNYDLYVYYRNDGRTHTIRAGAQNDSSYVDQNLYGCRYTGTPLVVGRDYLLFKGIPADSNGQLRFRRVGEQDQDEVTGFQIRPAAANTAPTAADNSITVAKNLHHKFALANFGFSDADVGDQLRKVQITALPANGTLTLNGATVLQNQQIAAEDIYNSLLRFTPATGATGTPYDTFQFKVSDGLAYSTLAKTMTLNVYGMPALMSFKFYHVGVGDPTYSGAAAIGTAGDEWNNIDGDLGWNINYTTVKDSTGAAVPPVSVFVNRGGWWNNDAGSGDYNFCGGGTMNNTSPYYDLMRTYFGWSDTTVSGLSAGTYDLYLYVRNDGRTHTYRAGAQNDSAYVDKNLYGCRYTGTPLVVGRDYLLFKGIPADANGQLRFRRVGWDDQDKVTGFQLRPSAANTAPTAVANTLTTGMNLVRTLAPADFGFADADVGDQLQKVQITALPAAGALTLSGGTILVNQLIGFEDIYNGNLKYTPAAYATGTPVATFQFKVSDGLALSASAYTLSVNVVARSGLISAKYRGTADAMYVGPAAVGTGVPGVSGDLWNDVDGTPTNPVVVTSVIDSTGATLPGVKINVSRNDVNPWGSGDWSIGNYAGNPVTSANAYYNLLRSYFGYADTTVSGLSPGLYDVYVYLHCHDTRWQQIWCNGIQKSSLNPPAGSDPLVENRDYVVFKGMAPDSNGQIRFYRDGGDDSRISGFQLVPVGTPTAVAALAVSMSESGTRSYTPADFLSAGLDFGSSAATVQITSLPASGTLQFNGVTLVSGDLPKVISMADLAAGKLTYTAGLAGAPSFNFVVSNDGTNYGPSGSATATVTPAMGLVSAKYRHTNQSDPSFSGVGMIGTAGDIWNDIDDNGHNGQAWTYTTIVDSTGTTVPGVSVQILNNYWGNNEWGNNDYSAGGQYLVNSSSTYYDLLRSYFGGEPQTRVNGLTPGGKYDLFVFLHTHDNRRIKVWCNGTDKWGEYSLPGAPLVINRDVMVFKGVVADGSGQVTFYRSEGDSGLFSGFQIRPALANTLPTGTDTAVPCAKNQYHPFTAAEFGFADADIGDSLAKVKVTSLPAAGALYLSGSPVLTNQEIAAASLGSLQFVPAAGASGMAYTSFQFKVSDGIDYSATAYAMTVNVYAMPNLISAKYRFTGNSWSGAAAIGTTGDQWNDMVFTGSNPMSFTSIIDSTGAPVPSVSVSVQRGWGNEDWGNGDYNINYYGTVNGSDPYYDLLRTYAEEADTTISGLAAGTYDVFVYFQFRNYRTSHVIRVGAANDSSYVEQTIYQNRYGASAPLTVGREYLLFRGVAADNTGKIRFRRSAGEGECLFAGFQLRPAAVNTPPTAADKALPVAKNLYVDFTLPQFGFADADPGDLLQKVKVTALPTGGALTLSGATVLLNQELTADSIANGQVRYTPATNGTGTPYDTFQFKVTDGSSYSTTASTMTLNVYAMPALISAKYRFTGNSWSGAAAIGTTGDQWNDMVFTGSNPMSFTSIIDSTGAPVPSVSVSVQRGWGNEDWGNGDYNINYYGTVNGSNPYYDLLRTYAEEADTTISGLAAGAYDVFVYFQFRNYRTSHIIRAGAANDSSYVEQTIYQNLYGASAPLTAGRDYLLFRGLAADSTGKIRIKRSAGEGECLFAGFQIRPAAANTAPTAANNSFSFAKNLYHTFDQAEFGFADADPGDTLKTIKVTGLPTAGNLYLTGWDGPVLLNQEIPTTSLTSLTFVPEANATGSPYATFQFKVSDGVNWSATAKTITFNVLPQAMLVNVNFYQTSKGELPYVGPAAVGTGVPGVSGDQWNNLDIPIGAWTSPWPNYTSIVDASGNPTGASLRFSNNPRNEDWGNDAYTTWGGPVIDSSSPYWNLMRSYIANDVNLTVQGLTPGVYDLYVYINSRWGATNTMTANNITKSTVSATGAALVAGRDYMFMPGVVVTSNGNLTLTRNAGEFLFSGFQLLPGYDAYFTTDKTSGAADLAVRFTDTSVDESGGHITNLHWDFGDGSSTDTSTPGGYVDHTYTDWGTYNARLTITNSKSMVVSSSITTITVTQPLVLNVPSAGRYQNAIVNVGAGQTVNFASGIGTFMFGGLTGSGTLSLQDASSACITLMIGSNGADSTFSGKLTGCGNINKIGSNNFTLAGAANDYAGTTTITMGKLKLPGGNVPTPTAWFDASTLSYTDGQSVDTWPDKTTNAHDATKTNGTMTLRANAVNGLPAVQFADNGIAQLAGTFNSKVQYIVTKMNGGDWGAWMGSDSQCGYMWNQNGNCWDGNVAQAAAKNGTALSWSYYLGDNRNDQYMVVKIVGNNNNTAAKTYFLGKQQGWISLNNYMAEILTYDHELTTEQDQTVGGYLATKYNITTSYEVFTGDANRLPATTNVYFAGGTMEIGNATANPVAGLYVDSVGQTNGTWGPTGSAAAHIEPTLFSGTGLLTVATNNETVGPPIVSNDIGATPALGAATLNGRVLSSGQATTNVTFYWGTTDGGTTVGAWQHSIDMGTRSAGALSSPLSSLVYGVQYYYRTSATNSHGTAWATSTASFLTLLPPSGYAYEDGLNGSMFQSTPSDNSSMNLENAAYAVSFSRVFTGTKAGTVLAMTTSTEPHEIAAKNIVLVGAANSWNEFGGSPGEGFVAALSGRFFPTVDGAYRFQWSQDDRGWLWIDYNDNGVFDTGESVGEYAWTGDGTSAPLTAGQGYNFMFFSQDHGGGDNLDFRYTPPGGTESAVNPTAQAGQWRHATGYSIPLMLSTTAATNVTHNAARLNASLSAPGTTFDVTAYWSTTDHGANTAAWEASSSASAGTFVDGTTFTPFVDVTGLAELTTYYCTFRATNAGTTLWSSNVQTFTTTTSVLGAHFTGTPTSGYAPLTVTFTDASTGIAITQRHWDFGDGSAHVDAPSTTVTHEYAAPGSYTVALTVTNSGGVNTLTRSDYVYVGEPLISVDFDCAVNPMPYSGAAVLGGAAQSWNHITFLDGWNDPSGLTNLPLVDSSGGASSVLFSYTGTRYAFNAWGQGTNSALFSDYLGVQGDWAAQTVTLSNLPAGSYDVYCYGSGSLSFVANACVPASLTGLTQNNAAFVRGGSYVVLHATVQGDGLLAITPNGGGQFAGFQVTKSRGAMWKGGDPGGEAWSTVNNWIAQVPNGAGAGAVFGNTGSTGTPSLDGDRTVSWMDFSNAVPTTLAGTAGKSLTLVNQVADNADVFAPTVRMQGDNIAVINATLAGANGLRFEALSTSNGGGSAILTLSGTNTYTGPTTLQGLANQAMTVLRAGSSQPFGPAGDVEFPAVTGQVRHWLDLNGQTVSLAKLNAPTGNDGGGYAFGSYVGNMAEGVTGTLIINNTEDCFYGGALMNGPGAGSQLVLIKDGPGMFTMFNSNIGHTWSGGFTIKNGTFRTSGIADDSDWYKGTTVVMGDTGKTGTLRYDGGGTPASSKAFTMAAGGTGKFEVDSGTMVLTGMVDGGGALAKSGAGTLELFGIIGYAGNTTVTAGTLVLDGVNSSNDATTVTLAASGAVLNLNFSGTDTVDKLYFGNEQQVAGTWGATGSGAAHIDDTHFSGGGKLLVTSGTGGGGTTYALAYDGNGYTGGTAPTDGSSPYASGALVTVQGAGTLVKTGYTFAHWNTAANGSGTSYNAADTFNIAADTTLYAQWTISTVTLTYGALTGGSITGTTPQTVNYGGSGSQVTATPALGYHFVSWSDAYPTASRTDTNVIANLSVTASFALNSYSLTYGAVANGSIVGTSPQTVNYGGSGTLVTATPATGYHFASWSDSYPTAARTDSPVTGDISVTASFAISSYALAYDGNGSTSGSVPAVAADHEYNSTITVLGNANSLKLANHTFAGWNTAADGSGTGYVTGNSFTMPATAVTLYAMWAPNYFLTEVKDNGGAVTKELTFTCAVPANAVLVAGSGACAVAFNGVTYTVEASTTLAAGSWTSPVAKFAMSYTHAGLPALPDGGYWKYQTFSAFEGLGGKGFIRRSIVQP